jgi:hypothetical protein
MLRELRGLLMISGKRLSRSGDRVLRKLFIGEWVIRSAIAALAHSLESRSSLADYAVGKVVVILSLAARTFDGQTTCSK